MNKKIQLVLLAQVLSIGILAKVMSLVTKIIMTRELGLEAMSYFSLVNPLIILLLTISSFSLQNSIGNLIAKNPSSSAKIFKNAIKITSILSIILIILLLILSKFISHNLLSNPKTFPSVIASIFVIPLTSYSSIIKGYYLGKGELKLTSFSQVFEECGRLLFIIIILYLFPTLEAENKASIAVFSLCIGEIFQVIYMVLFHQNNQLNKIKKFFKIDTSKDNYYHEIFTISVPMTLSRLVGSLTYFLEPIIFMMILSKNTTDANELSISYGLLNSYALPLLLMPGFISVTLSNLLIPSLGKYLRNHDYNSIKRTISKIFLLCILIGVIISTTYYFFADEITTLIYGAKYGSNIIKKYTFFFIIYYIEHPLITSLSMFNLSKKAFNSTVISSICRLILIFLLVEDMKIDGLCIAIISSTYVDVILNLFYLKRFFKRIN